MLTPAFSTVACPEWTLDRVALAAQRLGFPAVELRTFGPGSRFFACDPALTAAEKVRKMFGDCGVRIASLATSAYFDTPVQPPVIGHVITDTEVQIRAAQQAIDIASSIECPLVRVFGFRLLGAESRSSGIARIVERLRKVIDHADRTGVTVVIENGGSFETSEQIQEITSEINSPLLRVCYNVANAFLAGENPTEGLAKIANLTPLIRVKDLRDGKPVLLGTGNVPVNSVVTTHAKLQSTVVFEWGRAWLPEIGEPDFALDHASRTLWQMLSVTGRNQPVRQPIPVSVY